MSRRDSPDEQLSLSLPGIDLVLAALPRGARRIVSVLLGDPDIQSQDLDRDLKNYAQQLQQHAQNVEFMDIELGRTLVRRCLALVAGIDDDTPEEHRRLIQTAVRYLILDEDSEGDTESPIGFDDDALVVELVAKAVGREDILKIK